MSVRSKRLWGPLGLSGNNVLDTAYTVPDGETALLKTLSLVNTSSGTAATIKVRTTSSATTSLRQFVIPAATEFHSEVWMAFDPGTTILVRLVENLGANVVICWGFGAELEGVAD